MKDRFRQLKLYLFAGLLLLFLPVTLIADEGDEPDVWYIEDSIPKKDEGELSGSLFMLFMGIGFYILFMNALHYRLIYMVRRDQPDKNSFWVVIAGSIVFPFYTFIGLPFWLSVVTAILYPNREGGFPELWWVWFLVLPFFILIHLFFASIVDIIIKSVLNKRRRIDL